MFFNFWDRSVLERKDVFFREGFSLSLNKVFITTGLMEKERIEVKNFLARDGNED